LPAPRVRDEVLVDLEVLMGRRVQEREWARALNTMPRALCRLEPMRIAAKLGQALGGETYGAVPLPMKFITRTMMKITMKM
jgi:hypothetical protein